MTRPYPQHQSITSPLASREKGDWGLKRPFPLKSTMATSTPFIRIKQVDTVENVTNFASAADHSLSLEKFQELRVAMSVPFNTDKKSDSSPRTELWHKSVFEEDMDFTDFQRGRGDDRRWKFQGPWLARMTEGEFIEYLNKKVRPKRAHFRTLLKEKLADDITTSQNKAALESGKAAPAKIEARDISEEQFTDYLRSLRNDRVTLYALVSKFLDLAPLGQPVGIIQTFWSDRDSLAPDSPYGKSGPPPSHPSAGISYLRTGSFMENHPVYGPQGKRTPALARVVYPKAGPMSPKLGVGGFVADAPSGDNEFNPRTYGSRRISPIKSMLNGIMHLDTTTFGGAKAYVEATTANVDPSGKVVLQLRETGPEAQVVARESKGLTEIYHDGPTKSYVPTTPSSSASAPSGQEGQRSTRVSNEARLNRVADEILEESLRPDKS
ncbi:mitochondrial ribosomal protein subunit domain-containing protein [Trichoderma breve]|uniref:Mitochondrial ribosomal protein subunit domain-containing protein n=1 Tax=Trichoderma breve TaxID=2034170 RepID=A0A9W9B5X5_9HYPO|nr:mitochondrial ribosomal protein subunit domain-containing protein [Trichoderma breve]KAJ4857097.1 mitochondrial ribosomal protein subunit domain-containing protein [Trichoderma breve]